MTHKAALDVWLDDTRPAPEGWLWCQHVHEVVALLKAGRVRRLELDHDLGMMPDGRLEKSGYDLCLWMAEHGRWPTERPTVHSMNPVGAEAMRFVIDRYFTEER